MEGLLRIGIADEFATTKLSGALGIFRMQHPMFEMRFLTGRSDYLFDALDSGDVDIILGKCHSGRTRRGIAVAGEPCLDRATLGPQDIERTGAARYLPPAE
jgi:DNA-binding transcriptional LysR family regulator